MGREEISKQQAKDRLRQVVKKKLDTTMIGSLASIEKYFGFLWGHDIEGDLTPQQEQFADLYEDLRSEILDKGNHQLRNFDTELANYEINHNRHYLFLPVKRIQD